MFIAVELKEIYWFNVIVVLKYPYLFIRNTRFYPSKEILSERTNWIPKYGMYMGICYSYHIPQYIQSSEILQISFHFRQPIDIYLHHPGQFLTWEVYSFPARLEQEIYLDTHLEVSVFLIYA